MPVSIPNNTWQQQATPTEVLYGGFTGVFNRRAWNRLMWNSLTNECVIYDGYQEPSGNYQNHIYANSVWAYAPEANVLTLKKVSNWGRSGGSTFALPVNATDPTPYDRHPYGCIGFSASKNALVLWGGANNSILTNEVGETWLFEFDTGAWRLVTPTLPQSGGSTFEQTAEVDPGAGVEGSFILNGARNTTFGDGRNTYSFDLHDELWTLKVNGSPPGPPVYMGHSSVFDPVRRLMWRFGGGFYPNGSSDLWKYSFDSNLWTQITPSGSWPSARKFASMAYDTIHNVVLMVGGDGGTDFWAFNPAVETWTQLSPTGSPGSSSTGNDLAFDPVNNVFVLIRTGPSFGSPPEFWLYRYASAFVKSVSDSAGVSDASARVVTRVFTETVEAEDPKLLFVPFTISEPLATGISGLSRTAGVVTSGVPLPEHSGVTSVSQLSLFGASVGQFRSLGTWPNGNIRWVLVDTQADVAAGGTATVSLALGSGSFGGSDLATDGGSLITVATGAATFTIQKNPFRVFDSVSVGATTIVSSGGEGVAVIAGGVRYTSANDSGGSVVVEENGPARCCVKATGTLKDSGGTRRCEYLARLHFYKGKAFVRAFLTLKNAIASAPSLFTFDSVEVQIQLGLGAGANFTTKTNLGTDADTLGGSDTAYLYQAYNTARYDYSGNAYGQAPIDQASQRGIETRKVGGTVYHALTGSLSDWAEGWMALEDSSGKGLTFGIRHMGVLWPAGLEAAGDGKASVQPFSKRNPMTGIKFAWGAYETREIFFDFHDATPASRNTAFYEMEYPLAARAPISHYTECGAIYGDTNLVTEAEQTTWFTSYGASSPSLANITPEIWRYYAWSTGGGSNQADHSLIDLIDWIRTGRGGFLIQGLKNSIFKADTATRHSDGFDFYANQIDTGDDPGKDPEPGDTNYQTFNGRTFDFEHTHWISMPIAYYLTGNELLREAVEDFAEWKYAYGDGSSPNYFLPLAPWTNDNSVWNMRIWSRYLRDFALTYDVTRNSRYWTNVSAMVDTILGSSDTPGSALPFGRNRDRGYMWQPHGSPVLPRIVSDFFSVQIHFEAVYECLRLLREGGDSRSEALEAYLFGLADFWYEEAYLIDGAGTALGDYGYAYSYKLDSYNNPASSGEGGANFLRPIAGGRMLAFAYEMTGDAKYLTRGAKLMIGDIGYVTSRTPSDYPQQALMRLDIDRPAMGWLAVSSLSTANLGGGTWRLSWTVPAGAKAYQIRYSTRTIRDWLGFDQQTRAYDFDSATNVAWFAADRVVNPPAPGTPGLPQFTEVSGLNPAATYNFAIRYSTSEAAAILNEATLTDTASVSDSAAKTTTRTASEQAAVSDGAVWTVSRTLSDSASLSDSVAGAKVTPSALQDSTTVSDAVEKLVAAARADQVAFSDSIVKVLMRGLSDQAAISDSASGITVIWQQISDTATPSDLVSVVRTAAGPGQGHMKGKKNRLSLDSTQKVSSPELKPRGELRVSRTDSAGTE